jgi:hypothetical protein
MRRMRTRLPTYLSTGLGALVDISKNSSGLGMRHDSTHAADTNTVKSCSEVEKNCRKCEQ